MIYHKFTMIYHKFTMIYHQFIMIYHQFIMICHKLTIDLPRCLSFLLGGIRFLNAHLGPCDQVMTIITMISLGMAFGGSNTLRFSILGGS